MLLFLTTCRRFLQTDSRLVFGGSRQFATVGNKVIGLLLAACVAVYAVSLSANQRYAPLAQSVRAALSVSVSDAAPELSSFHDKTHEFHWLGQMSPRLERRLDDGRARLDFLRAVHYESSRAGLNPQLVLAIIETESNFRKYAISKAGARGLMQVMPFWQKLIGRESDNLFHLRTNLRYGCIILRHYLDIEKGNVFRALGRYNGSLGKAKYPNKVLSGLKRRWQYQPEPPAAIAQNNRKNPPGS